MGEKRCLGRKGDIPQYYKASERRNFYEKRGEGIFKGRETH